MKIVSPVLLIGVVGLILWSQDDPAPDVSDFIFEPLRLPEDQNAYAVITKAAQLISSRELTDEEENTLAAMLKGDAWDESIAQACVSDLAPAWPLIERITEIPEGQTPWISALSDVIPEIGPIQRLSNLIKIRALAQARSGHPDEGLRSALIAVTLAHRIEESRGVLIHFLSGSAIKRSALNTIQWIVVYQKPSNEALLSTLRALSASRASTRSLSLAFYSELRIFEDGIGIMQRDRSGAQLDGSPRPWLHLLPRSLLLKPNKTRTTYVRLMRASANAVDAPLPRQAALLNPARSELDRVVKSARWTPNNFVGRIYLGIITPTTSALLTSGLRAQSGISACEALLALRLYKNTQGEFPASLEALVPEYLPSVPRDYMDGSPIRYSQELGVIWSVGDKNLNITKPDQLVEEKETVIYITPRPLRPVSEPTKSLFGAPL